MLVWTDNSNFAVVHLASLLDQLDVFEYHFQFHFIVERTATIFLSYFGSLG